MSTHTKEQGLRVFHLINLGGLIALAGLHLEPPDPRSLLKIPSRENLELMETAGCRQGPD
jgi:hypothetical protein